MSMHDDERRAASVAASADADLLGSNATPEDRQFAGALASSLSRLGEPRLGFQDQLERQLLARLSESEPEARSWWQRFAPASTPAERSTRGRARLPRRSLLGLAAGAAVALCAASLLGPFGSAPEASASDIMGLSQARAENPGLAGVKSFHLTATSWGANRPGGANDITTEQWFVSPDKMRTETRSKDTDGKSVISGFLSVDGKLKTYVTEGASAKAAIGIFMAPIGQKAGGGPATLTAPAVPADGTPQTVRTGIASLQQGPPGGGVSAQPAGVVSGGTQPGSDGPSNDVMFIATRQGDPEHGAASSAGSPDEKPQIIRIGPRCPEPKRTGEDVIAGRPAFKVDHDMSTCLPAEAPAKIPARTVSWVDKTTFLPLKLEGYDKNGNLLDRYQVQSIEYDLTIPDSVFTNLPAGVTVQDNPFEFGPPPPPAGDGDWKPGVRVISTQAPH